LATRRILIESGENVKFSTTFSKLKTVWTNLGRDKKAKLKKCSFWW
jgi:hypothetical protein